VRNQGALDACNFGGECRAALVPVSRRDALRRRGGPHLITTHRHARISDVRPCSLRLLPSPRQANLKQFWICASQPARQIPKLSDFAPASRRNAASRPRPLGGGPHVPGLDARGALGRQVIEMALNCFVCCVNEAG
jgi:hypothetical protein